MVQLTPPQVLYEVPDINVYHLEAGHETRLNEYPAPLKLLMVSTTTVDPFSEQPTEEEDFYLHIQQLPNLDLPLPATTQIFRKRPRSYLIPRIDLDGGHGSTFTRVEFPENYRQDDVDTFETILAQCTAFQERVPEPQVQGGKGAAPAGAAASYYTSAGYPDEKKQLKASSSRSSSRGAGGYVPGSGFSANDEYQYGSTVTPGANVHDVGGAGRLVLVDEQDGRIVGELSEGFNVVEQQGVHPGSKAPVEVSLPTTGGSNDLIIKPVEPINHADIFSAADHPAYAGSTIVSKAAWASKFIVTAATYAATAMENGAQKFTQKTQPVAPLTFTPTTHDRVRKIHTFTAGASGMSSKTIGKVQEVAQNIGAKMAGRVDKEGNEVQKRTPAKPGILNKSMIAFSTLADGIDAASKHILTSGSNAATTVVGHRYGEEAKHVAHGLTGSVKNVGLVYVDAAGVSRRAVVKSVAKGMVLGKVKGGGQLVAVTPDGTHANVVYPGEKNDSQQALLGPPQGQYRPSSRPPTPQPYMQGAAPPAYMQPPHESGSWGGFNSSGNQNPNQNQNQNQNQNSNQYSNNKPSGNWF